MSAAPKTIRTKFTVQSVTEQTTGRVDPATQQTTKVVKTAERVVLTPVASSDPGDPNRTWSRAAPSGILEMYITSPGAWGVFE
jgi:hypothetical protein